MSSAAAAAPTASPKKGRKKIIIIAVAVVLLLVGGIAAFIALKSGHAADEEEEVEVAQVHKKKDTKRVAAPEPYDPKNAPTFVQLEVFTVNLADHDADRYAQVGITLEVEDGKAGEQIKAFMPAIRNNILLVLARKTSADVRSQEGKRLLAAELHAQALRPLGYDLETEDLMEDGDAEPKPGAPKRKKRKLPPLPIKAVHFANFIVQ
ncbi:flagellar basal body-associated FliL family protein [Azohydromonas aeria]|uniref:flagellar basal body-associated FliL family protein n=1 Tax=Azohydromonas aeria TaxID=2590212 RepID=UPI0012F8DEBA|nr:flagellar basal body-associated FliL family protein [Azohydromonas aeria]